MPLMKVRRNAQPFPRHALGLLAAAAQGCQPALGGTPGEQAKRACAGDAPAPHPGRHGCRRRPCRCLPHGVLLASSILGFCADGCRFWLLLRSNARPLFPVRLGLAAPEPGGTRATRQV